MSKLRRRHLDGLAAQLENITDGITAVRRGVERNQENEAQRLRNMPSIREDFVRIEALLGGVKTALERMGGTTLPGFREDIQALRHEMGQYHREMASLNSQLPKVMNFIEALHVRHATDNPQPAFKAPKRRGRGRRDKAALDEVQQLGLMDQWRDQLDRDVAEAEAKPKRRGRPRKDTSQKLMDEPAQEVVEE